MLVDLIKTILFFICVAVSARNTRYETFSTVEQNINSPTNICISFPSQQLKEPQVAWYRRRDLSAAQREFPDTNTDHFPVRTGLRWACPTVTSDL